MGKVAWHAAILDEAAIHQEPRFADRASRARALQADHRLALTGTPIENRLLDLWSIMGFAMPGVLGNRAHFARRFDATDDPLARRRLAARVRPFLLRRTKAQVAKDLPDRIEEDLLCEMEGEQKTLYRAELKRAQHMLLRLKTNAGTDRRTLQLPHLAAAPAPDLLPSRARRCRRGPQAPKAPSSNALLDLLEPLMEEGHKVLVFSQFVTMLESSARR